MSKLSKNITCQQMSKLLKKKKEAQNVGQLMFHNHSDQVSQDQF